MALYVTRPRRDEVQIGRGLPSDDRECSKNELRMFILFGEGITPLSRRDKSKNTPTTIKIFQSILWFVQMKWEIIATFNQPAYIIIALLKLVY